MASSSLSSSSLRASSSLPRRHRPKPSLLQCAPAYILMCVSMLLSLVTTLTSAAPASSKASNVGDNILDGAKSGPYNLSIQAGIAGAILIVLGLVLCFFGYRIYHVTLFIVGFYFLGNLTYIGMVNAGVSSNTLLLVISIAVGVVGGIFLVFCSRLGVAILGALALYALGLWILGWKPNGVITSNTGRIILLVALAVVGFIVGLFSPDEMVIVGTAIVGAYSFIIGVDFYAHTGFKEQADSFINSKNTIDSHFDNQPAVIYAMLGSFLALAVIGMIVQFYSWGRRRPFRPATVAPIAGAPVAAPVAGAPVYASKPSRFAGFWRRRNYY